MGNTLLRLSSLFSTPNTHQMVDSMLQHSTKRAARIRWSLTNGSESSAFEKQCQEFAQGLTRERGSTLTALESGSSRSLSKHRPVFSFLQVRNRKRPGSKEHIGHSSIYPFSVSFHAPVFLFSSLTHNTPTYVLLPLLTDNR